MDEDMDVHLRWNHHQTTLLSVFSSLRSNENLVDCTISAEGQHFKAHRVILSACSPYFESLFSEHCETHPVVILPDAKFQILKALMEFMYSGEVKVPQDKLGIFLGLAEALQIKGLSSAGDSEVKDNLRPKRRNESSVLCEQKSLKKRLCEHRYGCQVKPKEEISSLHNSEEECSEDIDPSPLAAQKCDKNSSHFVSPKRTVKESAMLQDISDNEAVNMLQSTVITKTLNKSKTRVPGTLLNSLSNILDSSQLSGSFRVKVDEQRMLSENVISTRLTSEESRTSEHHGERSSVDILPQIKQEDPDAFNSNSINEIILDDDTDESDNCHHDRGSGGNNSNTVGRLVRVIPEQSFSAQGICSQEQFNDAYFVEPASLLAKQFRCNACGRSYRYDSSLARHLKYECGKEPQFGCFHCPARFFHNYDLKVHLRMTHKMF